MSAFFKFNCFFQPSKLLPSGFPYHKLVILGLKLKLCLSSSSNLVEHFESFRNEPYGERLRGRVIFVMRLKGVVASKKKRKTQHTDDWKRWLRSKKKICETLKCYNGTSSSSSSLCLVETSMKKNEKIIFEAQNPLARSLFFTLTHLVTYIAQQRWRQATIGRQAMSERVKDGDDRS